MFQLSRLQCMIFSHDYSDPCCTVSLTCPSHLWLWVVSAWSMGKRCNFLTECGREKKNNSVLKSCIRIFMTRVWWWILLEPVASSPCTQELLRYTLCVTCIWSISCELHSNVDLWKPPNGSISTMSPWKNLDFLLSSFSNIGNSAFIWNHMVLS